MIMELTALKRNIEKGEDYNKFKEDAPESFLAHAFVMVKQQDEWQLGYYDPKSSDVTTFDADCKKIGSDKALGAEEHLNELKLAEVTVGFTDAMAQADALVTEKYSAHTVTQRICVLQVLEKALWNITLITNALSTINIHIDAATGGLIKEQEQSLMTLGKQLPGKNDE